ncbi:MAG: hypothetical protein QOE36_639 [Gaiellaceae bacterium]|jgi:uncharacterized membrane protein|nr:hypothetical protein [Gaiellaceae bacterium]
MALAVVGAVAAFLAVWVVLHHGFYTHRQIVDTPVYVTYGNEIAQGKVPYRDFAVEYPPAALPVFAIPSVGHAPSSFVTYRRIFETLMWLCGALTLLAAAGALAGLGAGARRTAAALGFAALVPLALGSVILSRFDLWPTLFCVAGLAALVRDRSRVGLGLLGFAIAAKLWPGVVAPVALAYVWRRHGRREALVSLGILLGVVAAWFVPFVLVSPSGVWHSLSGQLTRPLQIESLGSSLLLAAHQAFGLGITMVSSHGSQNLDGSLATGVGIVQSLVQIAVLVGLWAAFARRPEPSGEDLVRFSAAAVCAFIALGKVLSPQFLIWLLPLVPLVGGRRGVRAAALLAVACVLTQLWFPFRYWDLVAFKALPSWLLLARDLALVALLAVLAGPALRVRDAD